MTQNDDELLKQKKEKPMMLGMSFQPIKTI